ncbi:ECF transporter S component [Enterococcus faecalis]
MKNTKQFTLTALFLAVLILLAVTPLGFITIGPLNATTMHIPVIIASIVLGPRIGGILGGIFGVISLIRNTLIQTPLSFVFTPFVPVIGTNHGSWKALLIVLIPRILIGIVPYFVFKGFTHLTKERGKTVTLFIAGLIGSMTNTILVMNMIYFLFHNAYGSVIGQGGTVIYGAIMGVILSSGIPEAIVAGIATAAISSVLLRLMKKNATQKL